MKNLPGIVFACQMALMISTGLLTDKQYIPFCDEMIEKMDTPPYWIMELAVLRDAKEARDMIYEYIADVADTSFLEIQYDLHAACLYVKYKRNSSDNPREWSTFLMEIAHFADAYQMLRHDCSYYYHLLDMYESSNDAKSSELRQSAAFAKEFENEIAQIRQWYEPFVRY
ncbi:hypothetical protein ACE3MZ_23425 [Paenibacillus sp. WLX1005]|uniref:hypothetical protein n=1 Tax=Paenibacillus sp. WLX1005 TaxID=3243766 RepID=UPI0039841564